MNRKPISVKEHAILDYLLLGCLLTIPSILKMNAKASAIYAAEALILLPYAAFTKQPLAIKGIIPLKIHKKVDSFNLAHFALQSFLTPIRKSKKALAFNIIFTIAAGFTVALTDWDKN